MKKFDSQKQKQKHLQIPGKVRQSQEKDKTVLKSTLKFDWWYRTWEYL